MAAIGLVGALLLPSLASNWILLAVILLFWGGCVSGMYTVGLSHLGTRLTGADLVAANAAFVFCYAIGMVLGPPTIGFCHGYCQPQRFCLGNRLFLWALCPAFGDTAAFHGQQG